MADTTTPRKKTWSTPEIYLLDTTAVKGGSVASYKEGALVGGTSYQLYHPGGPLAGTVPKAVWDNFHS
jgi:hypothetical protein